MNTKMIMMKIVLAGVLFSFNTFAGPASVGLVKAAKDEIRRGSDETACSIFIRRVIRRAGYAFPEFLANDFDSAMKNAMPNWSSHYFMYEKNGKANARKFLNSLPNQTATLVQWPRRGRSGHVAMVVKEGPDQFRIYQAQLGERTPHTKPIPLDRLIYQGGRANIRFFIEEPSRLSARTGINNMMIPAQ